MENYLKGVKPGNPTATEIIAKMYGSLNVVSDKNGHLHVENLEKKMEEQRIIVTYPRPVSIIGRISVGWRSDTQCELFVEGKIRKQKRIRMSYKELLEKVLSVVKGPKNEGNK